MPCEIRWRVWGLLRQILRTFSIEKEAPPETIFAMPAVKESAALPRRITSYALPSIHSTTLGEVLPKLSLDHLAPGTTPRAVADFLVKQLGRLAGDTPFHVVSPRTMEQVAPGAGGAYFPNSGDLTQKGPILLNAVELFNNQARITEVILHEGVHAVTSNIVLRDPLVRERVSRIMSEALQHIATVPEKERPYGFTNEREFITESFSNLPFQQFLGTKMASRELTQQLGLTKQTHVVGGVQAYGSADVGNAQHARDDVIAWRRFCG